MLALLAGLLVAASPADAPVRRGAVPLGISLTGGLGAAQRIQYGVDALFTLEVGLAVDLSPSVALTAEVGWKAGALTTGVQYRFNFSRDQRFVPRLGAGLAISGVDFIGLGLFADTALEWRVGTAFALYVAVKYSVTLLSLVPGGSIEPQHQLRETAGVVLSL